MAAQIRIGTSGWHYKHWCGPFYPKKCPSSQWFELYARVFDTVEVNNTLSAPNRGCPPELARRCASQVLLQREGEPLHHSYQAPPRPGQCHFSLLFASGIAPFQAGTDPLSASAPVACRSREAGGFSSGTAQRTPVRVRVSR